MALITVETEAKVALITLNDPKRRNVISADLSQALADTVDALEADEDVHAIVITGAPPAFCAGGVLDDLEAAMHGNTDALTQIYAGFLKVAACSLPTVAAVNGPAVGAGMNLALACDMRMAGASARFDCRFLDIALHPGGGHTWMLNRAVGWQTATAMLLTNQIIDGPNAERLGLAWKCVADDALIEESRALLKRVANMPRPLIQTAKASMAQAVATDRLASVDHEFTVQLASMQHPAFAEKIAALKARIKG